MGSPVVLNLAVQMSIKWYQVHRCSNINSGLLQFYCYLLWVSLMVQIVKNLPAVQETGIGSLGQKDPLKKGMATHSGILAWRIPWTLEPGRLSSIRSQRVKHDWVINTHTIYIWNSEAHFLIPCIHNMCLVELSFLLLCNVFIPDNIIF